MPHSDHPFLLNPNNLIKPEYKSHGSHSRAKSILIVDEAKRDRDEECMYLTFLGHRSIDF